MSKIPTLAAIAEDYARAQEAHDLLEELWLIDVTGVGLREFVRQKVYERQESIRNSRRITDDNKSATVDYMERDLMRLLERLDSYFGYDDSE